MLGPCHQLDIVTQVPAAVTIPYRGDLVYFVLVIERAFELELVALLLVL